MRHRGPALDAKSSSHASEEQSGPARTRQFQLIPQLEKLLLRLFVSEELIDALLHVSRAVINRLEMFSVFRQ
jgi:hypothetical protein